MRDQLVYPAIREPRAILAILECKATLGMQGDPGDPGMQGDPGDCPGMQGDPGEPGNDAPSGPLFIANIGTVAINDGVDAEDMPTIGEGTIDFNDYFDGASTFAIMSVAPAQVGDEAVMLTPIIKSITESDTTAGVFEFALLDDVTTYEPSVVTVRATDEDGLWSEQMFDVRRNRAPDEHRADDSREAGATLTPQVVTLGDVSRTSGMLGSLEVFIDDDAFTVAVADADDSDAAIAGSSVDNILGNILFNSTGAGQTTITLEATDTGDLKVTNEVTVNVYAGPKVKEDAPAQITLSVEELAAQVYPVPVSALFDVPDEQTAERV